MTQIQSADVVKDQYGRQYHIDLAPGELAEYIILVGEAARVIRASSLLTDIRVERHNREYKTFTGKYKGVEVSIMSSGMGPGCVEIGMIEIFQVTKSPTVIRVGTSGGLQNYIELGDAVISTGAVRLEDTSTYFVHPGFPAVAHYDVVKALIEASKNIGLPHHVGLTATASGFYGAQGRKIPGINQIHPNLPEQMANQGVLNFEMEASTLFTLCTMKNFRSSAICQAIASRTRGTFVDNETKALREKQCLIAGLDALVLLHNQDNQGK